MTKYKLLKDIIGAKKGTEFKYGTREYGIGISLVSGESLGNILDLIKAIGIDDKNYFKELKG